MLILTAFRAKTGVGSRAKNREIKWYHSAVEPTVIKTLVEKMIVNNTEMTVYIHFKCGVVIREVLK